MFVAYVTQDWLMLSHRMDHSHRHQASGPGPSLPTVPLLSSQAPISHTSSLWFHLWTNTFCVCIHLCLLLGWLSPDVWMAGAFSLHCWRQTCPLSAAFPWPHCGTYCFPTQNLLLSVFSFCVSPFPSPDCDPGGSFHHSPHWVLRAQLVNE